MLHSTSVLLSSSLTALSLRRACNISLRCYAAAAAAGNAPAVTTKRRRRSRADEEIPSSPADTSTSTSSSSSSPDAWRASLPEDAPATALAAALRRSLALSGTKPESALALVADAVKNAEDARAAFDAAAALRAARVERGQRGELRPRAHSALASAAVRAAAAEVLQESSDEASISKLLAATLGRARRAGMPVGAKTFSEAARTLQRAVKEGGGEESSSSVPLLASAAKGVLSAALGCRVKPSPALAAALLDAAATAGGDEGATAAEALAAEFEANGVRLSAFAVRALARARSGAAAAEPPAEEAEDGKGE